MKKIASIFFFLLGILELHAQEYIFEYDVEFFLYSGRRRFYNHLYYTTANSSAKKEFTDFYMHREQRDHFGITGRVSLPANEGPITHIWAETSRQVKDLGFWNSDCEHTESNILLPADRQSFLKQIYGGGVSVHIIHM